MVVYLAGQYQAQAVYLQKLVLVTWMIKYAWGYQAAMVCLQASTYGKLLAFSEPASWGYRFLRGSRADDPQV